MSRTGLRYCVIFGENHVSWCLKKQQGVSHSTMEAEYHSFAFAQLMLCSLSHYLWSSVFLWAISQQSGVIIQVRLLCQQIWLCTQVQRHSTRLVVSSWKGGKRTVDRLWSFWMTDVVKWQMCSPSLLSAPNFCWLREKSGVVLNVCTEWYFG